MWPISNSEGDSLELGPTLALNASASALSALSSNRGHRRPCHAMAMPAAGCGEACSLCADSSFRKGSAQAGGACVPEADPPPPSLWLYITLMTTRCTLWSQPIRNFSANVE